MFEELNEWEIAKRLGSSQPAVSKRLERVLVYVRRHVGVGNVGKKSLSMGFDAPTPVALGGVSRQAPVLVIYQRVGVRGISTRCQS